VISIVMNPNGNPHPTTAWTYTVTATRALYNYLSLTEDTNLTTTPIKFAPTPFVATAGSSGGSVTNDFEPLAVQDFAAGQQVGNWTVTSNQVSVVNDPVTAYQGKHFLALADGGLSQTFSTVPGQTYTLSLAYRGPGSVGLWAGENNTVDSILGNNGTPIGTGYGAGIVGQAFQIAPRQHRIAIPDNPAYDLTNYTYDGWINSLDGLGGIFSRADNELVDSPIGVGFGTFGQLNFSYDDINHSSIQLNAQIPDPTNRWIHVACVLDFINQDLIIYTNGSLAAQQSITTPPVPTMAVGGAVAIGNSGNVGTDVNFNGRIDESTLYNRALSPSEIKAIYNQGILGQPKYDVTAPTVSQGLAEAQITVGGATTELLGQNTAWQTETITFTATSPSTVATIQGVEPGMLIDELVSPAPATNNGLYYLPEQSISDLIGQPAAGLWQLEVQDNRAGAGLTNILDSWQLEFKFANFSYSVPLSSGQPQTNVVNPNSVTWYEVNVPYDANFATNRLIFASAPVNFLFSPNDPPSIGGPGDGTLGTGVTSGSVVFSTNTIPPLITGGTYFLGVQNNSSTAVTNVVEVDFDSDFFASQPPVFLLTPANTNINALTTLMVTNKATDADPTLTLTYSLINPPLGATIDTNGVITWTPTFTQGGATYTIITAVTNSEDPPLGTTNVFTVTVIPVTPLPDDFAIYNIVATNEGGTNGYLLSWYAATNYSFRVKWTSPLVPTVWHPFTNIITYQTYISPTNSLFQFFDDGTQDGGFGTMRYYRVFLY
jgi:hypothetical protein